MHRDIASNQLMVCDYMYVYIAPAYTESIEYMDSAMIGWVAGADAKEVWERNQQRHLKFSLHMKNESRRSTRIWIILGAVLDHYFTCILGVKAFLTMCMVLFIEFTLLA